MTGHWWMVRAGGGGEDVEHFIQDGIVAFGDPELGPLPQSIKKEALLALYAQHFPNKKEGSRASWASQLMRFVSEIKVGEAVVTFDRDRRLYFFGTVTSEYEGLLLM